MVSAILAEAATAARRGGWPYRRGQPPALASGVRVTTFDRGVSMAVTYFVRMRAQDGREEAVRDLLLSNVARIDAGERGNVVFAVHASNQDPREFWLYETWTDPDAVEAHESGPAFKAYKDDLRPLVDPDSLVFGDAEPLPSVAMRCPSRTPWRGASSAPWAPTTTRCSTRSTTPT